MEKDIVSYYINNRTKGNSNDNHEGDNEGLDSFEKPTIKKQSAIEALQKLRMFFEITECDLEKNVPKSSIVPFVISLYMQVKLRAKKSWIKKMLHIVPKTAQPAMESATSSISVREHLTNEEVRRRWRVEDVIEKNSNAEMELGRSPSENTKRSVD
ncbi:hypothetical protein FQA39_LY13079 [Lamprigera yunnana]|nr:hypothetical protein FQA39_LY13079 [Lamprigera yunnana]